MATTTASQRREEARTAYNAFMKGCPTNLLLSRISDKWVGLVLSALKERPQRYSDLGRRIAGVSQKMLTQTLRTLERDGLVSRTVTPSVPVRVDYALTPLGASLATLFSAVKEWAEENIEEVVEARERYDAEAEEQARAEQAAS
ncbi:helix-turn-helix domain-containing protein [Streptomyces sp. NPDC005722]